MVVLSLSIQCAGLASVPVKSRVYFEHEASAPMKQSFWVKVDESLQLVGSPPRDATFVEMHL